MKTKYESKGQVYWVLITQGKQKQDGVLLKSLPYSDKSS